MVFRMNTDRHRRCPRRRDRRLRVLSATVDTLDYRILDSEQFSNISPIAPVPTLYSEVQESIFLAEVASGLVSIAGAHAPKRIYSS